jgi:hypothetical protein
MQHDGIRQQAGNKIGQRHPARRDDDRPDESTADFFANGLDAGAGVLFDAGVPRKNKVPKDAVLLIPEPEPAGMQPTHGVKPGYYNSKQMLQLLDLHKDDADAAIPLRTIPKGLNHSAQRCRASGYAGLIVSIISTTLKELNHLPALNIITPCRNRSPRFLCIRFFQPKTVAHFFATNRFAKNCTATSAAS